VVKVRRSVVIERMEIVSAFSQRMWQSAAQSVTDAIRRKCLVASTDNDFSFALPRVSHVNADLRVESRWAGAIFGAAQ